MNKFEEIDNKKKELESAYMNLVQDPHFTYAQELSYVYQYYSIQYDHIQKIHEYLIERQRLVELHFMGVPIPLSVHEQYHEVSNQLQTHTTNFFSTYKTLLNAFATLITKVIPENDRNFASGNSFGAFLHDCKKSPGPSNSIVAEIFRLFASSDCSYNDVVNKYRNKYIEHSSSLSFGRLSTSPASINIFHQTGLCAPTLLVRSESQNYTANHTFLDDIVLITSTEDHVTTAYVHLYRPPYLPDEVDKSDYLGYTVDNTNVHFAKYGPHTHIFPPLQRNLPFLDYPIQLLLPDSNVIQKSPEVFSTMVNITSFTTTLFILLKKYIDS